ncbi:MAG: hypothetical protein GXP48_12105 [Acidobacteria bacterium]|nr:hypothetical protein [Acidobacteriota bacterium]
MRKDIVRFIVLVVVGLLTGGLVSAQGIFHSELARSVAATVGVGNNGEVVLSAPDEHGTTLILASSSRTERRFEGRFLYDPTVFPDGRISIYDSGKANDNTGLRALLLDPSGQRIVWEAPHTNTWSFDSSGQVAVWTPCLYCASEMPNSDIGREAARYVGKGLVVAIDDTRHAGDEKMSLVHSNDGVVQQALRNGGPIGNGVFALGPSTARALVLMNWVPYILQNGTLSCVDPNGQLGGPALVAAVSPSGRRILFDSAYGRFMVWDLKTETVIWASDAGMSLRQSIDQTLGLTAAADPQREWFVGEDEVAFAFGDLGVVVVNLEAPRFLRAITWPEDKKLATSPGSSSGLRLAVSPDGKRLVTLDRNDGTVRTEELPSGD